MGRMHMFEIEDQSWCPRFIREATTDVLFAIFKLFQVYEPAYAKINEVLDKTKTNEIIDCCSGSSGPIKQLRDYLDAKGKQSVKINLTDKFPHIKAYQHLESLYPQSIQGHQHSIDATQLPIEMQGMRTFFSSFHHFKPNNALKILQNAVDHGAPIGIFESVHRTPMDFIRALSSLALVPLLMPFAKRLDWRKFLFTYIIPLTPLTFTWDYIASNVRAYSEKELHVLVKQLNAPGYEWDIGKLWSKRAKGYVYYLTGYKKQ